MKRILAGLLILLLLCSAAVAEMHIGEESPEEWKEKDILRLTQLDTNRSDCLLLECGGQVMLIDGGYPSFRNDVAEYLRGRGITHFDMMFNTHPHDDHVSVMYELLKMGDFTADMFYSPFPEDYNDSYQRRMVKTLKQYQIPYTQVHEGDTLTIGGATMEIHTREQSSDMNRRSAMTMIRFGQSTALLCADIPSFTQTKFVEALGDGLQADICKAPHHGLVYMEDAFLKAVNPKLVTICTNKLANDKVSRQCKARDIPYMRSGDGVIIMETDGTDWYVWQLPHKK